MAIAGAPGPANCGLGTWTSVGIGLRCAAGGAGMGGDTIPVVDVSPVWLTVSEWVAVPAWAVCDAVAERVTVPVRAVWVLVPECVPVPVCGVTPVAL